MITEETLKGYQVRVAALEAEIKKHPDLWQLKDDLRVYEALVRRAKIELGWPVCRDSGCNSKHIFEIGNGEWACIRHGGKPLSGNRK